MAGSQRYLDLLEGCKGQATGTPKDIQYLWDRLGNYDRVTDQALLLELARTTYAHISKLRDVPIAKVIEKAKQLHIDKNAGYAGAKNPDPWANFRLSAKFGVAPRLGVMVRMSDKYIRWQNLTKDPNNERVGESVIDTLEDFAAYALIAFCIGEEQALK